MTYQEWSADFSKKRENIFKKLELEKKSDEEFIDYFVFENMVEREPDFCLLYKEKKKCHNTAYLNCMFCACPNFRFDDEGIKKVGNLTIKSECSINSKKSGKFVYENVEHLDCTNCFVPHTKAYVSKNFTSLKALLLK